MKEREITIINSVYSSRIIIFNERFHSLLESSSLYVHHFSLKNRVSRADSTRPRPRKHASRALALASANPSIIRQDPLHDERRFGEFSLLLSQAGRARVRMCEIESRARFFARRCFSVLVSQRQFSCSKINSLLKLL